MDIVLNRRGGVPVKDQLRFQLELKILVGDLQPGQRLPSVRALARRLRLHPNTVSAAYKDLEGTGHVDLRKGAGVFVRPGAPTQPQEARGLDQMIRLALYLAFQRGFSGAEIRAAVERWLAAAPPDRVVVVDPSREMGELMAHEIREALKVPATACVIRDVQQDPALLAGALALALPYHLETVAQLAPAAAVEPLTVEISEEQRQAVLKLPEGSILLLVSHSPTVLPFAQVLLRSLRGDEIVVETRALAAAREWRRVLPAADIVVVDALSADAVRRARPRRLIEVRFLSRACLERVRETLRVVIPRAAEAPGAASRA